MNDQAVTGQYSLAEEIAHSITHGLGLVLSVVALVVLVVFASLYGNAWHIVSCSIYGSTLVLLYAASTFYHALSTPRAKVFFRTLDHSAIYLLIAGTYTPFLLVNLRGGWGWSLLCVVWGLAFVGVVRELSLRRPAKLLNVCLYLGLGWIAAVAAKPMFDSIAAGGLLLIALGGLAYTAGVVFYCWNRVPYNHAIWHIFVLAGSMLHYFAVLFFVIPAMRA